MTIGAVLFSIGWLAVLVAAHWRMMRQPGPQELNEPAAWYATWLLDQGRNPYTLKELPAAAQFFGPLYNYVVLAFKPLLGIDYTAHRIVNFLCLAATIWLVLSHMLRAGSGWGVALLSTVFFYRLCIGNIMITARPDALGLWLFLVGILVPWERDYRPWPTVAGLACALLAFHCKAYFGLAAVATILGVAVHRSKGEALVAGIGFSFVLGATIAACIRLYPFYYLEIYRMQRATVAANMNLAIWTQHSRLLLIRGWPFLLLLSYAFVDFVARYDWRLNAAYFRRNWLRLRAPLTAQPVPMLGLVLLLHLLLVQNWMGANGGATFTYHIQLLFPFFSLVLGLYTVTEPRRLIAMILLGVCTGTNFSVPQTFDSAPIYETLARRFQPLRRVLAPSTSTEKLVRQGKPVYNDGFTIFLPGAFLRGPRVRTQSMDDLRQCYYDMLKRIREDVVHHRFDVIVTQADRSYLCDIKVLQTYYEKQPADRLDLQMQFGWDHLEFWYPKTR